MVTIFLPVSVKTWKVRDVARRSTESVYHLTHLAYGYYYRFPGLCEQLKEIMSCLLDDGCGFAPRCQLGMCYNLRLVVQDSRAIQGRVEPGWEVAEMIFKSDVVVVGNTSFAAQSGSPGGLWEPYCS
jgi:hypothetical protein